MKRFGPRSLRLRLTIWYSCALVIVMLVLAGASRWALAISLDRALDQGLRYRLIGLHQFVDVNSAHGFDYLTIKLRDLETLGELFQVVGPDGRLLAQSNGLARHHVGTELASDLGARMLFRNGGPAWFRFRIASQRIYTNGRPIIIEVADPQGKFGNVLSEFYLVLLVAFPFLLLFAAIGGYWLSGRALAPVDQIIDETRSIDPDDLSARLSVPQSRDELQGLSETLNQLLERVEQSVLRTRRFTADASHELRAPMTLIYTAAQFALRRERSLDDLKDALQKIVREAKRCTELINQLLFLARTDAGSNLPEFSLVDPLELVLDASNQISSLASERGLTLKMDLPKTASPAVLDEVSFRRMLLILLDNAVKYTPAGGLVTTRLSENTNGLAISVCDSGPGIPAEQLPFIFDRFWRADTVRSRDAGGTGLGLAIAREIAQSHRAELTVECVVGRGTIFTVHFRRPAG